MTPVVSRQRVSLIAGPKRHYNDLDRLHIFAVLYSWRGCEHQFGRVRKRTGSFVEATPDSMFASVESDLPFLLKDFRGSIADAPGERHRNRDYASSVCFSPLIRTEWLLVTF